MIAPLVKNTDPHSVTLHTTYSIVSNIKTLQLLKPDVLSVRETALSANILTG